MRTLESKDSNMSTDADGLPSAAADPVSPLLAFLMNSAVRMGGAMIAKGVEVVQEAPGKLADMAAATTAKVSAHVDNFSHKPSDTPETVRDVKAREREHAIEAPALPEIAKSAAIAVGRAEALENKMETVSLQEAMGKQVVAASMERNVQQMGLA